jgi:antitoxin (DNA-binding transcriptional repressor) of toxin-antitoxin stability system
MLSGSKMTKATVEDVESNFAAYLDKVHNGETIEIISKVGLRS